MASEFAIRFAAHEIRQGGIIIYPTETVYGLGCDPMNATAVHRLCELKQRNIDKGLILLASNLELFEHYTTGFNADERNKILQAEQPTSWVVPASHSVPYWLTGHRDTLVIRITNHPVVTALCNHLKHPLVSTSANPAGSKPATNALELHKYFQSRVQAFLVSGHPASGQPSTIRSLADDLILRH